MTACRIPLVVGSTDTTANTVYWLMKLSMQTQHNYTCRYLLMKDFKSKNNVNMIHVNLVCL